MRGAEARIAELLIGTSSAIQAVRALIARVAPSALSVFIDGETGAGKELVAEAVHLASGQSGALVPVNVCAIPDGLFDSEMFGHTKGAFTGAVASRAGYVMEADRGTLFLDEIGTLSPVVQAKLLRVLETRRFYPVGSRREQMSRFRLLSATNLDIDAEVAAGRFREDLRQRLSGVVIHVPPLRERVEDIPALVRHVLDTSRIVSTGGYTASDGAIKLLMRYHWPGNVRELRHVVERSMVFAAGTALGADLIARALGQQRSLAGAPEKRLPEHTVDIKLNRLMAALEESGGDTVAAARLLGVSRSTVYRWMHQAGSHTWRRTRNGGAQGNA